MHPGSFLYLVNKQQLINIHYYYFLKMCHFYQMTNSEVLLVKAKKLLFKMCVCAHMCALTHVQLFVTPWTVANQAPLSMGFPRQEYWSGSPFPTSRDLPDPEMEPTSLSTPGLAGGFFTTAPPEKP